MTYAASQWKAQSQHDPTKVPATQVGDAWLAKLPADMLDTDSGMAALSGGGDLLAYTTEPLNLGTEPPTRLSIHVVTCEPAAGGGDEEVWIRIPTMSSLTPTDVWWVNGDPAGSQPGVADPYGRNETWSSVEQSYSFAQDPGGAAPQLVDGTGNNDGTASGAMVSGDLVPGEIGNAWNFEDSKSQFIDLGVMALTTSTQLTVSVLDQASPAYTPNEFFISRWGNGFGTGRESWALRRVTSGVYSVIMREADGTFVFVDGVTPYADNAWHSVVATMDGTNVSLYVDSVLEASASYDGTIAADAQRTIVGALDNSPSPVGYKNGGVDQAAIRYSAQDLDAITAHDNNQFSPSTFWTTGATSPIDPAPVTTQPSNLFYWYQ